MTRAEFEKEYNDLTGSSPNITNEDYKFIEYVYAFYPTLSETDGKKQIATLFSIGGMTLIKDMGSTAKKMEGLEGALRQAQIRVEETKSAIEKLKNGYAD